MCSAPVQTLKNLKLHYAELSLNSSVLKNLKYSVNQISSVMNSTKSDENTSLVSGTLCCLRYVSCIDDHTICKDVATLLCYSAAFCL